MLDESQEYSCSESFRGNEPGAQEVEEAASEMFLKVVPG